jgi:tetratricopeptide (TPR) repeat protein
MLPLLTLLVATAGVPHATELAALDTRIEQVRTRFEARPSSWTQADKLVALLQQRVRLTGDYRAFVEAEAALAKAFEVAPEGSGPILARAELHAALHRLDAAESDLATLERRPLRTAAQEGRLRVLRADLLLQRGDLDGAGKAWADIEARAPTIASAVGLARVAWRSGDHETAETWFDAAASRYHGHDAEPRAWVHLQLGLLDLSRCRYAEALAHYEAADAELDDYWLVTEHMAEALVALGRQDEARALYERVVTQTPTPELREALAEQVGGDRATKLREEAATEQAWRAERFPEAVAGHAHIAEDGDCQAE